VANPVSEAMRLVLKARVFPELRARGFKGSFPTLIRDRDGTRDRITFQFSQWGGGFYVNINSLLRLGARAPLRDHLFELPDGPTSDSDAICERRGDEVLALLDDQAERWWREGAREYPEYHDRSSPAT
jgi:hypothetical protein